MVKRSTAMIFSSKVQRVSKGGPKDPTQSIYKKASRRVFLTQEVLRLRKSLLKDDISRIMVQEATRRS